MRRRRTAWEDNFAPHIFERGVDYYVRGLVHELKRTDGTVTAIVSGTEDYEVELELANGEIDDMFCTCPYAEGGNYCKHEAAVCLAVSADSAAEPPKVRPETAQDDHLREIIEVLSEAQLRELLLALAAGDRDIRSKVIAQLTGQLPEGHIESLKAEVDAITEGAEDADGYIDYRNAWDYTASLEDFLRREAEPLLRQGLVMEAFELTCYAFLAASAEDMDDSDGGLTSLGDYCGSLWKAQVDAAKPKQREAMFTWFETAGDGNPDAWFEDFLSDVQLSLFQDPALMEKSLAKNDKRLAAAEAKMDENKWCGSYELSRAVMDRLTLMDRLHRPPEELAAFRARYRHLPDVREAEIKEHIRSQRYDEAVALLVESKTLDAKHPGLVAQYSGTLIDIYEKTGQTKALADELRYQVLACCQTDLQFINRLKALTPSAQWQDLREDILRAKTVTYIRLSLLESEELWQRLLDELAGLGSCESVDRFEKTLKKHYPEEVKALYLTCLRKRMPQASDRKAYRALIRYLGKVAKYPDGRQAAQGLADEWRESFPRRRSMLDELKKAGF